MRTHGEKVRSEATQIVAEERRRQPVLGVDPHLILVVDTNRLTAPEDFRLAGLQVLDSSTTTAVVAFADDPQLTGFLDRLARYQEGVPEDRSGASYEGFFDAIEGVRRYGASDRITARLDEDLRQAAPDARLLVDVECWYPQEHSRAAEWTAAVEAAAVSAGGVVVDTYIYPAAPVALVRIEGDANVVRQLADLDVIATVDSIPAPPIWAYEATAIAVDDLPALPPSAVDAPLVGLVDSGVRSAHEILAGTIYDTAAFAGLSDAEDRSGHGTAIASLLVRGPLEAVLATGVASGSVCRLISARVLADDNLFPRGVLWAHELDEAIRYCCEQGAKIVNVSVGDPGTPFHGPRSTPVAAVIDALARELDVVIVVSSGNVEPAHYEQRCNDLPRDYPVAMLADDDCALIDPAPAALALTVGAIVTKIAAGQLGRRALGEPGWPSPFSRRGPGIQGAIKPELVAPGGTMAFEQPAGVVQDPELECLVADGRTGASGLVAVNLGTSFAVPLVSRTAAAIRSRYPRASSNLVRALVLQGADDRMPEFLPVTPGIGADRRAAACRQFVGYGEVRLDEAVSSRTNRAVLVAEDEIDIDGVHIYEIPIPRAFFESGGHRFLTVSLAFNPDTRARRLDYLSSRMKFEIVRGLDPAVVERLFLEAPDDQGPSDEEEDQTVETGEAEEVDQSAGAGKEERPTLSGLSTTLRPKLEPSATARSLGANQLARRAFHQRLKPENGESFLLVVQNTNRWANDGKPQPYAVAVALGHSEEKIDLYAELEVALRERVRARVEVEEEVRA